MSWITEDRPIKKSGPRNKDIDGKSPEFRKGYKKGYMTGYAVGCQRNGMRILQRQLDQANDEIFKLRNGK